MKPLTHTRLLFAAACLLALASCNDFGKKITFPGNKGEVYYKGEGVTEADAKAVGNFLSEQKYFDNDKTRSVQISKNNNRIAARFVVNKNALDTVKNADASFELIGAALSRSVFNNTPVDVIYTDDAFKDIRTLAYKPAVLGQLDAAEEIKQMLRKDHNQNTLYYSKDFTEQEANDLFDYLVKSKFFVDEGNNDLIVAKMPGNGYHFKFSVKNSFANDEGYKKVDDFVRQMKQDLFSAAALEFEVMDENMQHLKTFAY